MSFKRILISYFCASILTFNAWAAESLSYSGRLVGKNGAPVSAPVNLRFNLAYTSHTTEPLCSAEVLNVTLNHGVFHVKLNFDCGDDSLSDVLANIPLGSSVAIQTIDISNSSSYSYQVLHSVPTAILADKAKDLAPLGAKVVGEVLTWDGAKWKAASLPEYSGGTVTSITAQDGLSGGEITESGFIGIANGGVTSPKLAPMGASAAGQVLKWNGSFWWADNDSGLVTESDPTVKNFAKMDLPMCAADEYYTHDAMVGFLCTKIDSNHILEGANNLFFTDSRAQAAAVEDALNDDVTDKAPSQNVVFDKLALKQDKIESSLKLTSGSNSVTLEAPTTGGDISYVLPVMGSSGQVLKLGPSNTLVWGDTGVSGSDIASNSITNSHVADGALSQSKISGLTTDLTAIDTRITNLKTDNVPEGTNKYFTDERVLQAPLAVLAPTTGTVAAMDSLQVVFNKIVGNANVLSGTVSALADNQSNYLLKAGDTMGGNLVMGGNLITGLGTPSNDSDAATKKYVDDKASAGATWLKNNTDIYFNTGKVGIGTTTPDKSLHISGISGLKVESTANDSAATIELQGQNLSRGGHIYAIKSDNSAGPLSFRSGLGGPDLAQLLIDTSGKVGIGTVSPSSLLHVNINSGGNHTLASFTNAGNGSNFTINTPGSAGQYLSGAAQGDTVLRAEANNLRIGVSSGTGHVAFGNGIAEWLRIISSGNVGIGTSNPNSRLTVDGVLALKEGAAPTLTADYGKLYVGTDSKLYFLNDLGVTTQLGSSDGGTPGDNTITSAKIADGSIVNADINASAGIAATKLGNGDVDNTELSSLNGVTGPIQTQIDNIRQVPAGSDTTKYLRGDNSWQTLTTSVVTEGTNQYFTEARVRSSKLMGYAQLLSLPLDADDTILTALGKLEGQITSNDTDIAALNNKGQWSKNGSNIYYSSGSVGIGVTAPLSDLHVQSATGASLRVTGDGDLDTPSLFLLETPGPANPSGFEIKFDGANGATGNRLDFISHYSGANTRMSILRDTGYVGIGTTSPANNLDISGTFRAITPYAGYDLAAIKHNGGGGYGQFEIINSNTNTDVAYFSMHSAGNTAWTQGILGSSFVLSNTAGTEKTYNDNIRLTVTNSGAVGISTTTPSEKLEVVGNVKATAYLYTSDRRLKENIETIENSSDKVLGLRGVEFDWKKDGKHEIGFIAQEVEAVEPNLVVTSEVDGIKAVKYGNVVALLVEAFKEHHQRMEENQKLFMTMNQGIDTRVKELEREVASLKDENKKLKEDIELIKKHLKIK